MEHIELDGGALDGGALDGGGDALGAGAGGGDTVDDGGGSGSSRNVPVHRCPAASHAALALVGSHCRRD
jgi:hypothetical protein